MGEKALDECHDDMVDELMMLCIVCCVWIWSAEKTNRILMRARVVG